jgi:hypothetical protein
MHPDFSATYSIELRSKPSDFIPTSWGGYDDTAPFGGELKYSYVNRIVEGLVQIVPISMRQEELVEKSLIFHEHKERSGMLTYRIGVRAICEEYGIEGFIPALEKFKLEIYRRFDAAIKVVEEEDSKDDLVDNMP